MVYQGGKVRIAKHIIPIMNSYRKKGQLWVEPFVGGANVIMYAGGYRLGADINRYMIALFNKVKEGWVPPGHITREQFQDVKKNRDLYRDYYVGFVLQACSFNGCFDNSYLDDELAVEKGKVRGINNCAFNSQARLKKDFSPENEPWKVNFVVSDYKNLQIPDNSLIYCDPPYAGTMGYIGDFSTDEFWEWCRVKSAEGHTVFVSETTAPDDFKSIWTKNINDYSKANSGGGRRQEHLFMPASQK